ncbi:MAG: hypothetical protein KF819_00470 [Labilithrix sp.]|nr:hypothetical protein [Labilithrix sp.]
MSRSFSLPRLSCLALPVVVMLAPAGARADEPTAAAPATTGVAAPAASAPAALAPAASADAAPQTTVVELAADDHRATIERRVGTTTPSGFPLLETGVLQVGQWEHQCVAPCALRLDNRYAYRVAGDGLVPSDSFSLPRSGDRVRVDAKMGSSTGRVAGVVSTGLGAGAMALGALALIATPILHSEDVGSEGFRTGVLAGGVSALSIGAIAVGVGLYLWFSNDSHVHTQTSASR